MRDDYPRKKCAASSDHRRRGNGGELTMRRESSVAPERHYSHAIVSSTIHSVSIVEPATVVVHRLLNRLGWCVIFTHHDVLNTLEFICFLVNP